MHTFNAWLAQQGIKKKRKTDCSALQRVSIIWFLLRRKTIDLFEIDAVTEAMLLWKGKASN